MMPRARLAAFYLPQFHPIPENDEWWERGFTEWTNTTRAKPMFRGHYQPHIPADLGFYDLRVPETREAQAAMARANGIEAFCYYHYWFAGRLLLQRPLEEVIASGRPDFPFCVCWANQSWTGVWHGAPDRVLIEQTYPGERDHRAHFDYLLPAFSDHRHMKVKGKPLFVIYRPSQIPDLRQVTDLWREMAENSGLPGLYLVGVHDDLSWNPAQHGFDACTHQRLPELRGWVSRRHPFAWSKQKFAELRGLPTIYSYEEALPQLTPELIEGIVSHPMLIHAWDNTPRSGSNGLVLRHSSPTIFRRLLRRAFEIQSDAPWDERVVFLKSWNEWAEGNHLEPDMKFGHGYLEAIREEVFGVR